jgi:hypothetical protein
MCIHPINEYHISVVCVKNIATLSPDKIKRIVEQHYDPETEISNMVSTVSNSNHPEDTSILAPAEPLYNAYSDILPPPNGYAAMVGASCDLRRVILSTPFAVTLALTSIATEERFTQSPCPGESAKPMRRMFFAALMSLS